jgi:MinD superfamily P-loop ATPase
MSESNESVTVDRGTCVVCGACASVCPAEALVIEGLELVVVSGRCRPCGLAALVCPTGALTCPAGPRGRTKSGGS